MLHADRLQLSQLVKQALRANHFLESDTDRWVMDPLRQSVQLTHRLYSSPMQTLRGANSWDEFKQDILPILSQKSRKGVLKNWSNDLKDSSPVDLSRRYAITGGMVGVPVAVATDAVTRFAVQAMAEQKGNQNQIVKVLDKVDGLIPRNALLDWFAGTSWRPSEARALSALKGDAVSKAWGQKVLRSGVKGFTMGALGSIPLALLGQKVWRDHSSSMDRRRVLNFGAKHPWLSYHPWSMPLVR